YLGSHSDLGSPCISHKMREGFWPLGSFSHIPLVLTLTDPHNFLVQPARFSAAGSGDFAKEGLGTAEEGFDALAIFGFGVAITPAHRVDQPVDPFDEEGGVFLAGNRFGSDGDEDGTGVSPGRAVEDVPALGTASPQGHPAGSLQRNFRDQLLDDDTALAGFCGARFAAYDVAVHDQFQGAE